MKALATMLSGLVLFRTAGVAAEQQDDTDCRNALLEIGDVYGSQQAVAEFEKADCSDHAVYCVGVNGRPLPFEEHDPDLRPNTPVRVKLFGPDKCAKLLTVATDTRQSNVSLFPIVSRAATDGTIRRADTSAPKVTIQLLASTIVTPDGDSESVTIYVARNSNDNRIKGITLTVVQSRYFLDVGVLVAFTPYYTQVSAARMPGLQDQFIRETNTIRPAAAIGVNYFPFGQYSQTRFSGYHGLGIQAAIGANFSRIDDEFYLGALWEPIPGAGLSAGLALLQMEKLQPDYPSGAIVQPNDVPKDTYLGPRVYFGVSLNTRVFQTLVDLGGKVHVPN